MMAEGIEYLLDHQQIYGVDYSSLEPNWYFHDEFTATNPIWNVKTFPRCSTPMPKELREKLLRSLPINTWMIVDKSYEVFKNGLKEIPDGVKVHGVRYPPQFIINGNLASSERMRRLREPTLKDIMEVNCDQLGAYVQIKHSKGQKHHSFNEKKQLPLKARTTKLYPLPHEESELNSMNPHLPPRSVPAMRTQDYPSVIFYSTYSDLINGEDTPAFNEEAFMAMAFADWTKSDETECVPTNNWSPERNVVRSAPISIPRRNRTDNSQQPSPYDDLDLSDLLHRLRIQVKDDYMKKHKESASYEKYEKYLYQYYTAKCDHHGPVASKS